VAGHDGGDGSNGGTGCLCILPSIEKGEGSAFCGV
jgi:hypothetical protein